MTFPTFTPPEPPVVGSSMRREIKLNRSDFGDGYSQITHGLNHIRRIVTLRWEALDLDDALKVDDFLSLQGGARPFAYAVPGMREAARWTCDEWTMTQTSGGYAAIEATFRQWFGFAA